MPALIEPGNSAPLSDALPNRIRVQDFAEPPLGTKALAD